MSQQNYPQRPNNPQQQSSQQGYSQQNYQQGAQQAPQGRPMPPQAPPPNYQQALPPKQDTQPEKVYVERGTNPILMVIKVITYPFVKILQVVGSALAIVFQEMVRSIVNFVFGLILLALFVALVVGYVYALIQVEYDFAAALPEMFRIFGNFFGFGG